MKTKVELLEEIVKKQDELILNLMAFHQDTDYFIALGVLQDELASLKSQLSEAGEEKKEEITKEMINPDCRINKLEFNCGYGTSCVMCSNYIPYVEP